MKELGERIIIALHSKTRKSNVLNYAHPTVIGLCTVSLTEIVALAFKQVAHAHADT